MPGAERDVVFWPSLSELRAPLFSSGRFLCSALEFACSRLAFLCFQIAFERARARFLISCPTLLWYRGAPLRAGTSFLHVSATLLRSQRAFALAHMRLPRYGIELLLSGARFAPACATLVVAEAAFAVFRVTLLLPQPQFVASHEFPRERTVHESRPCRARITSPRCAPSSCHHEHLGGQPASLFAFESDTRTRSSCAYRSTRIEAMRCTCQRYQQFPVTTNFPNIAIIVLMGP